MEVADEGHRSAALRAPSLPWLSGMASCCTPCVVAPNDTAAGATRMELVIPPGRDSRDRRIEMFDANEEKNLNAWMDALSALGVPVSRLGGARARHAAAVDDDRRYSKGLADDSRQLSTRRRRMARWSRPTGTALRLDLFENDVVSPRAVRARGGGCL